MHKILFVFFTFMLVPHFMQAQAIDPVVFSINAKPVYKSEVEKAYKSGNDIAEEKQDFNDFIESYINYRLNIEEAKAQHLDKESSYLDAYDVYKAEMVSPFMKDTVSENEFTRVMYGRLSENVELNHVMVPFDREVVFPADTLDAYNKIISIREEIEKKGFSNIDFGALNGGGHFKLKRTEDRNGYIGWITAFMLPYQVEDAAYSLPFQQLSKPIRSARGYHVIQVLNKRPAVGSVEVEQVMFNFPHVPPKANHIDSVKIVADREYAKLKSTADFDNLCERFSKAYERGDKGCYFGIIDLSSNFPADFVNAAFNLKNPGDISQPVMSIYGFHIIRLLRKMPLGAYNQKMKQQILEKTLKSAKVHDLSEEKRKRLLSQFKVETNKDAYAKLNDIAKTISPRDSLFISSITNGDEILLDIEGERQYPVREFARYIKRHQMLTRPAKEDIQIYQLQEAFPYSLSTDVLQEYYDVFVNILVSDYAKYTLEQRNPIFGDIMAKFSNDLLAYEVLEKNVWKPAKEDKAGLADFFTKNKKKYLFDTTRYKGVIVSAKNEDALKKAKEMLQGGKDVASQVKKMKSTLNKESAIIKTEQGIWAKGENSFIDHDVFSGGTPVPDKDYPFYFVSGYTINTPEDYTDVINEVELDYQAKLEKDWYSSLRKKYKVDIKR